MDSANTPAEIRVPAADALAIGAQGGVLISPDGEVSTLDQHALKARLDGPPLLLCHARAIARRCGRDSIPAFDLLELFAFVHPARFCLPTPADRAIPPRP